MRDYYKVLRLGADATEHEIRSAYRRLAFRYHPDRNRYNPIAVDMFKMINEAYSALSNPDHREAYRNSLQPPKTLDSGMQNIYPAPVIDPALRTMIDESLQDKFRVSRFLKSLLWIDILMSLGFLLYYRSIAPSLPAIPLSDHIHSVNYGYSGGGGNWIGRLMASSYLGVFLSVITAVVIPKRGLSRCFKPFIIAKVFVFIYLVTGIFGLTTIEAPMLIPGSVALWNVFLIGAFAIGYLDRELR